MQSRRVGIVVVAYNAVSTLAAVLDRIPQDFRTRIDKVFVGDDHSTDATYLVGLGYQQVVRDLPLVVVRHPRNLGYGGNQKAGYRWAIDSGLDIVVLLHGDGQYAPEVLPQMIAPLEQGECDAVFGSRMLEPGAARRGGMPFYKYVGNRMLSTFENRMAGTEFSEWHSGYRAYRVAALKDVPFARNDDGFAFDTQLALQLLEAGKRIVEIPIPTYYGDEICYVNGLRYAWEVSRDAVRYRAHKSGLGTGDLAFASAPYQLKRAGDSSHGVLLDWLKRRPPGRLLDLGCADGLLSGRLRERGWSVTGVDRAVSRAATASLDEVVLADLDAGLPVSVAGPYDVVLAADVLEHIREPGRLLAEARERLAPGGRVVASVPNFAHWYPRVRVATGRFDYDRRGILDRDHVRLFTHRSFERLAAASGYAVVRRDATGVPFEVFGRTTHRNRPTAVRLLRRAERAAVSLRPSLFAYQLLYELEPA